MDIKMGTIFFNWEIMYKYLKEAHEHICWPDTLEPSLRGTTERRQRLMHLRGKKNTKLWETPEEAKNVWIMRSMCREGKTHRVDKKLCNSAVIGRGWDSYTYLLPILKPPWGRKTLVPSQLGASWSDRMTSGWYRGLAGLESEGHRWSHYSPSEQQSATRGARAQSQTQTETMFFTYEVEWMNQRQHISSINTYYVKHTARVLW